MTQTEKEQKQAELRAEMASLQTTLQMKEDQWRALEATPVTSYKVWEPRRGEPCFLAATLAETDNDGTNEDQALINAGIAFETQEEAQRKTDFLVMLQDLHKFAVEHNEGWKPDWEDDQSRKFLIVLKNGTEFIVEFCKYHSYAFAPYFKTKDIAQKAIDTFGDRLKILFEYYNS